MNAANQASQSPVEDFARKLLDSRHPLAGWAPSLDEKERDSITNTAECISALLACRGLALESGLVVKIDGAVSESLTWLVGQVVVRGKPDVLGDDRVECKFARSNLTLDNVARTVESLFLFAALPSPREGEQELLRTLRGDIKTIFDIVVEIGSHPIRGFHSETSDASEKAGSYFADEICALWMGDILYSSASGLYDELQTRWQNPCSYSNSFEIAKKSNFDLLKECLRNAGDGINEADRDFLICFELYCAAVEPRDGTSFAKVRALCNDPMLVDRLRAVEAQGGRVKAFFPPVMLIAMKALHGFTAYRPCAEAYRDLLRNAFCTNVNEGTNGSPYTLKGSRSGSESRTFCWAHYLRALAQQWPGCVLMDEVRKDESVRLVKKIVLSIDIASSSWVLEKLTLPMRVNLWLVLLVRMRKELSALADNDAYAGRVIIYKFTGDGWLLMFDEDVGWLSLKSFLVNLFDTFNSLFKELVVPSLETELGGERVVKLRFGMESGLVAILKFESGAEYVGRPINMACRLEGKTNDDAPPKKIRNSRSVAKYTTLSTQPYVAMSVGLFRELQQGSTSNKIAGMAVSTKLKNLVGDIPTKVYYVDLSSDMQ